MTVSGRQGVHGVHIGTSYFVLRLSLEVKSASIIEDSKPKLSLLSFIYILMQLHGGTSYY